MTTFNHPIWGCISWPLFCAIANYRGWHGVAIIAAILTGSSYILLFTKEKTK